MVLHARRQPVTRFERRAFQAAVLAAGLVPVVAGLGGVMLGVGLLGAATTGDAIALDSHVRYLSGLLLGVGLAFWATVPAPEIHTARYRLLTGIVFLGGLARLGGALALAAPPAPMLFGLVMELVVTPALCLWQGRIARGRA
jgi:hypothetical protein